MELVADEESDEADETTGGSGGFELVIFSGEADCFFELTTSSFIMLTCLGLLDVWPLLQDSLPLSDELDEAEPRLSYESLW